MCRKSLKRQTFALIPARTCRRPTLAYQHWVFVLMVVLTASGAGAYAQELWSQEITEKLANIGTNR